MHIIAESHSYLAAGGVTIYRHKALAVAGHMTTPTVGEQLLAFGT